MDIQAVSLFAPLWSKIARGMTVSEEVLLCASHGVILLSSFRQLLTTLGHDSFLAHRGSPLLTEL